MDLTQCSKTIELTSLSRRLSNQIPFQRLIKISAALRKTKTFSDSSFEEFERWTFANFEISTVTILFLFPSDLFDVSAELENSVK